MPVEMLSTLDIGHAANSSRKNKIEYLGKGGIMEYKSGRPKMRVIDCLKEDNQEQSFTYLSFDNHDNDDCNVAKDSGKDSGHNFLLHDLSAEIIDIDCFSDADEDENFTDKDVLIWACNVLEFSPSARVMIKEAVATGWRTALEDLNGGEYIMDVEDRQIFLGNNDLSGNALVRSEYFLNGVLTSMIKVLRDIWQEKRHGGFDEHYAPEDVILMEHVRAADLDVVSILVAWELREAGYNAGWRHIMGSDKSDMAMVFSGCMEGKKAAQTDLRPALLATFKQWFRETQRVDKCDRDTLEYLDEVLETNNFINPFGDKNPGKMDVEKLSRLPNKQAYLQGQGAQILKDEVFSTIPCDINKAYLRHIMDDIETIRINGVSFHDSELARKIFPDIVKLL